MEELEEKEGLKGKNIRAINEFVLNIPSNRRVKTVYKDIPNDVFNDDGTVNLNSVFVNYNITYFIARVLKNTNFLPIYRFFNKLVNKYYSKYKEYIAKTDALRDGPDMLIMLDMKKELKFGNKTIKLIGDTIYVDYMGATHTLKILDAMCKNNIKKIRKDFYRIEYCPKSKWVIEQVHNGIIGIRTNKRMKFIKSPYGGAYCEVDNNEWVTWYNFKFDITDLDTIRRAFKPAKFLYTVSHLYGVGGIDEDENIIYTVDGHFYCEHTSDFNLETIPNYKDIPHYKFVAKSDSVIISSLDELISKITLTNLNTDWYVVLDENDISKDGIKELTGGYQLLPTEPWIYSIYTDKLDTINLVANNIDDLNQSIIIGEKLEEKIVINPDWKEIVAKYL